MSASNSAACARTSRSVGHWLTTSRCTTSSASLGETPLLGVALELEVAGLGRAPDADADGDGTDVPADVGRGEAEAVAGAFD
jgi:hypothetical protein